MLKIKRKKHSLNFNKIRQIYGLGKKNSLKILTIQEKSFFISKKKKDLNEVKDFLNSLQKKEDFVWGLTLRRKKKQYKEFLDEKNDLKAQRRKQGLPVHGQRTHSNGKTSRKRYF